MVRADSGFCREELLKGCEANSVSYGIGMARNERLRRTMDPQMQEAARQHAQAGKPVRVFTEFDYQTTSGSWSRARRIVCKCEQIEGKKTRVMWSPISAPSIGPHSRCTRSCTANAETWRTASKNSSPCLPGG